MLKYIAIFFFFLIYASGSLRSQMLRGDDLRAYRIRQIQEVIREKLHLPEGSISGIEIPGQKNGEDESILSLGEEKVSTGFPESEVHAAINPTDTANIVVGAMNDSPTAGLTFPIYYTTNFGTAWKKSSFKPLPYEAGASIYGGGDPVFAYDANGLLYMSWIDLYLTNSFDTVFSATYWASSTNGGLTWQRANNGYIGQGAVEGVSDPSIDDKEWITVDRSNSQFRNSLYVAWTHIAESHYGVMVRRKPPGLDSMLPPVQVSPDSFMTVQFTSLGVDPKGGLHVTFMGSYDTINYGIYQAYSPDGGATFNSPVEISKADIPGLSADAIADGDMIFGVRSVGNYPCPHLSIDTAGTGNLYEVWCALGIDSDQQQGADIYISRSTDNGSTWSTPSIINNDRDTEDGEYIDHFYPSIAVDGKGMISVGWYDRREDPNNIIGRYYLGQSTDQGKTWTNAPVATQPMDFSQVMDVNQTFGIGEYTQVVATPGHTIPVWTDGRDNEGNLRVYAAFIAPGSAGVERISLVDEGLELLANYPNPFSTKTNIGFTIASAAHATLYVTNIAGQRISTVFDGMSEPGEHDFTFDGSQLPSGTYYLNLESDLGVARSAITILH